MSLSYLAAAPPEAILVEGQRPTPQFTFQRILTFSWVKALGPHKHMPNSLPMFAALIELTRLPGAGYRLHDWSTYPLLLTYSQRKQFYKIIRVLSLPQCNLPLHVPSAFPMTSHASTVEQHHLPKAILTCFCLNTLMPSSGRSFGKKKKVFMWQSMCRSIWLFHQKKEGMFLCFLFFKILMAPHLAWACHSYDALVPETSNSLE